MRSVPTVLSALLLGGLGLIAASQTQVVSPGAASLPTDTRLIEQLDDQEATLHQCRQAESLLRRLFAASSPVFTGDNLLHHWLILV